MAKNGQHTLDSGLPVIEIASHRSGQEVDRVAEAIGRACGEIGFFVIRGHAVALNAIRRYRRSSTFLHEQGNRG